ncbi:MAG: small-conductance mechanosensitive channel [Planctomycetota bacterium]|jgi:small-conductance mechanosensitive channel
MTAKAHSSPIRLWTTCLFLLITLVSTQTLFSQVEEIDLDGKKVNARRIKTRADGILKKRDALQKIEKRTPAQEAELKALDALHVQITTLYELKKSVENGNQKEINDLKSEVQKLENEKADAEKELKDIKLEKPATEEYVTELVAIESTKKQDKKVALTGLAKSKADEAKRTKEFEATDKILDALNTARAKLVEGLGKEALSADDKPALEAQLLANECQLRITELRSLQHANFLKLDRARQERDQATLSASTVEEEVAAGKVRLAREDLKKVLEKQRQEEVDEAAAKKKKALNESSPILKAVLRLESFVADLRAQASSQKQVGVNVTQVADEIATAIKQIDQLTKDIDKVLPKDVDLDPFKESYLKRKIKSLELSLETRRQLQKQNTAFLTKVQKDFAKILFAATALQNGLSQNNSDTNAASQDESPENADQEERSLATWLRLNKEWENAQSDLEAAPASIATDYERAELPERIVRWDKSTQELTVIVSDRVTKTDSTLDATTKAIGIIDQPVEKLEELQRKLNSLAFWLKEDPPFGEARRAQMREEVTKLKKGISGIGQKFLTSLFGGIKDFVGILGSALIGFSLLVFGFLRSRGKTAKRAMAAFQRTKDPLYRLISMTVWLVGEISHFFLALLGMMLIWRSPIPQDPIACAIFFIVILMAARLAILRILLYAEVSDQQISKLLFIDARRILRITVFGLFAVIPAMAFFQKSGLIGLEQATGLVTTCWLFAVALRMAFRRDIILLLLPSKDIGALSRGLKMLVHYFWPLLTIFIAAIAYLKFIGFRTASDVLAIKSLLGAGILVAALVTYQFIQAYIDSKTNALVSGKDGDSRGHSEGRIEKKHRDTVHRMYSLPLVVVTTLATIFAMGWAFGITGSQWEVWSESPVVGGESPITLGNFVAAAMILIFGYVISATIRDVLVTGAFAKKSSDSHGTRYALGTLIFYVVMIITLISFLSALRIDLGKYGWLLGSAGVALGFGMTEILSNFVCGIILFIERPVQVGDIITVGDVQGDVRRISIRSTVVQTRDGVSIILPNRRLIESDVVNWSHNDPLTRLRIDVGVAYGSDVALVKKALTEVAEREGRILKRPRVEVSFKEFGESELSFQLLTWMPTPDITAHRRVRSDLNSAIDAAFRRFGIEIPFPQRDLHLKTTPETIAKSAQERSKAAEEAEAEAAEKTKKGISLP